MPIYEFKCDVCGTERELILPFSESGKKPKCQCGQLMRRKFSPVNFTMPKTGKDDVLDTLNKEEGRKYDYPGGDMHRARYDKALAKGLDPPKPVIGKGF